MSYAAQGLSPMNMSQPQMRRQDIFLKIAVAIKTQPSHWAEGIIFQDTSLCFKTNSKAMFQVSMVIGVSYDLS